MKYVVRAYFDEENRRKIVYEKRCHSFYELHIAVEEALVLRYSVIVIKEVR